MHYLINEFTKGSGEINFDMFYLSEHVPRIEQIEIYNRAVIVCDEFVSAYKAAICAENMAINESIIAFEGTLNRGCHIGDGRYISTIVRPNSNLFVVGKYPEAFKRDFFNNKNVTYLGEQSIAKITIGNRAKSLDDLQEFLIDTNMLFAKKSTIVDFLHSAFNTTKNKGGLPDKLKENGALDTFCNHIGKFVQAD